MLLRLEVIAGGVLAAVSLLGCTEAEDSGFAGGCDITDPGCQTTIFSTTASLRGQPNAPQPPVQVISLDEFAALVRGEAADAGQEPGPWDEALVLAGLLPEASTIAEESAEAAIDGVAAFYDSETKAVTVIDRGSSDYLDDTYVLAHEFTHALQDQQFGLDAWFESWVVSLDSALSARCLVEGEANVLGVAVLAVALERSPDTMNWAGFTEALRAQVDEAIEASPAPLLEARLGLPYPLGTAQLAGNWLLGGQRYIDGLYEQKPASLRDWAEDTRPTAATRTEPLPCEPTQAPPGFAGYDWDSFGPAGLLALGVTHGRTAQQAWQSALAFRGDRIVLFENESVPGSYAIAWRIRFDTPSNASALLNLVQPSLSPAFQAVVADRELTFYAATDPASLEAWDHAQCGSAAELPVAEESEPETEAVLRRLGPVPFRVP